MINGNGNSPPHSMTSYPGMKYLTEDEPEVAFSNRMSGKRSPAMKEEPIDSDVSLQISMFNL
jgi:hypothetical protein